MFSRSRPQEQEEEEEHLPSELCTSLWASQCDSTKLSNASSTTNTIPNACAYYVAIQKDKLTARYVGKGNHSNDFGCIRSNYSLPRKKVGLVVVVVLVVPVGTAVITSSLLLLVFR